MENLDLHFWDHFLNKFFSILYRFNLIICHVSWPLNCLTTNLFPRYTVAIQNFTYSTNICQSSTTPQFALTIIVKMLINYKKILKIEKFATYVRLKVS
jgi:hypothetical protein